LEANPGECETAGGSPYEQIRRAEDDGQGSESEGDTQRPGVTQDAAGGLGVVLGCGGDAEELTPGEVVQCGNGEGRLEGVGEGADGAVPLPGAEELEEELWMCEYVGFSLPPSVYF
jgi:hypothetical protein